MQVKKSIRDNITVFELTGRLDVNTSVEAQAIVMESIEPGCKLILDMSGCNYISSAGLRALLVIAKQLAKVSGQGALIGLLEEVRDVMEMTGFDNIFSSYDSFEAAAASF